MPLTLWRRSRSSFDASDMGALADWLRARDYVDQPTRNPTESARLERDGALIVCYRSSAIVCQGRNQAAALALLTTLPVYSEEAAQ